MGEIGTVALKGAGDVVQQLSKELIPTLIAFGHKEVKKISVDLETGFTKILERKFKAIQKIKTLANPSTPINLDAVYVSPDLMVNGQRTEGNYFSEMIEEIKFCVVSAYGGSGKSIFLKHVFIEQYLKGERIPIFVELRLIEEGSSIKNFVLREFSTVNPIFDENLFNYSLRTEKYIFLLDGFDEISSERRSTISSEITEISHLFGENLIIVTSRPDDFFQSWNLFHHIRLATFTREQSISLIKKINFSKDRKKSFLKYLEEKFDDSHQTYMSNPLLCIIMLLTFNQKNEIPSEMHIFFKMAFEALLFRHDTQKAGFYKRAFRVDVGAEKFTAVCSAFSAFSYVDYGSSFKKDDAMICADKALRYVRIEKTSSDLLFDLCTSISITVEEGGQLSFIHRSFQEYLTAVFFASRDLENWGDKVEKIFRENSQDNVVPLLSEINPDKFQKDFLRPRLRNLISDMNEIDESNVLQLFNLFYFTMGVQKEGSVTWVIGIDSERKKWTYMLSLLQQIKLIDRHKDLNGFQCMDMLRTQFPHLLVDSGEDIEVREMTTSILRQTPLGSYFEGIKSDIIAIEASMEKTEQERRSLLSDLFFSSEEGSKNGL